MAALFRVTTVREKSEAPWNFFFKKCDFQSRTAVISSYITLYSTKQNTLSNCHLYSVVQDGIEVASGRTEGGTFVLHRAVESVQNILSTNTVN